MTNENLLEKIMDRAQEELEDIEIFLQGEKELTLEIFQGEISKYNIAETEGLSLRGTYRGKMGYAYTEKLDESSIDMLISELIENSKFVVDDGEVIYGGSKEYRELEEIDRLDELSIEEKIELLKTIEAEGLDLDSRISPNRFIYTESLNRRQLINNKGVNLKDSSSLGGIYYSVIARDGEDVKTGGSSSLFRSLKEIEPKEIAKEAVEEALSMLGAKTVKSDDYKVVFENETFASLIASFLSVFQAEEVQKGLSLLEGKLGETIASDKVNIVDDPFLENGYGNRSFDGEGTATKFNSIVEDGVLKTYLHNWKTAKKEGLESTGHAGRHYKGSITTSVNNFYLQPGAKTEEDLLDLVGEGIYLNSLQGLHSGLDPVSGDFSLSASGYRIEGGKKTRPVNQITVSGNFFELFKNIEEIASNLDFGLSSSGRIGSASVYVSKLSIAGE